MPRLYLRLSAGYAAGRFISAMISPCSFPHAAAAAAAFFFTISYRLPEGRYVFYRLPHGDDDDDDIYFTHACYRHQ